MARSKTYAARRKDFVELTDLFRRSGEEQQRRLDRVLDEVLGVARLLPLEAGACARCAEMADNRGRSAH